MLPWLVDQLLSLSFIVSILCFTCAIASHVLHLIEHILSSNFLFILGRFIVRVVMGLFYFKFDWLYVS